MALREAEIGCFHAISIYHVEKWNDGIYLNKVCGLLWHSDEEGQSHIHQVAEEAGGNGRYAIP